jgi:DNA-binding MarR family transcriptional regulator
MSDDLPNFEAARDRSLGQLLLRAARLYNEAGVRAARQAFPELRVAHTRLLPHLDWAGLRQTELAERVGVTKQAIGPLIRDLEAMGLTDRVPDPLDGRAQLVRYAPSAGALLLEGLKALGAVEGALSPALDAEDLAQLRALLARVIDALDPR